MTKLIITVTDDKGELLEHFSLESFNPSPEATVMAVKEHLKLRWAIINQDVTNR